jgi:hypothetical protein
MYKLIYINETVHSPQQLARGGECNFRRADFMNK